MYWQIKGLAKKIDRDVVYASKPLFASLGLGLIKKLFNNKPLILDIDYWKDEIAELETFEQTKAFVKEKIKYYNN